MNTQKLGLRGFPLYAVLCTLPSPSVFNWRNRASHVLVPISILTHNIFMSNGRQGVQRSAVLYTTGAITKLINSIWNGCAGYKAQSFLISTANRFRCGMANAYGGGRIKANTTAVWSKLRKEWPNRKLFINWQKVIYAECQKCQIHEREKECGEHNVIRSHEISTVWGFKHLINMQATLWQWKCGG